MGGPHSLSLDLPRPRLINRPLPKGKGDGKPSPYDLGVGLALPSRETAGILLPRLRDQNDRGQDSCTRPLRLLFHSSLVTALQRSGTRTTIVSFTRAMSEENESLPTPFIGWTRLFKGFTVTRSLACGSRAAWAPVAVAPRTRRPKSGCLRHPAGRRVNRKSRARKPLEIPWPLI